MSLILEALRKSEAERQRGRAPGLFVEQGALRPAAHPGTPAWAWALGLLLVALLLAFGWREWSRQAAPAAPPESGAEPRLEQTRAPDPVPLPPATAPTPAPVAIAPPEAPAPRTASAPVPAAVPPPARPATSPPRQDPLPILDPPPAAPAAAEAPQEYLPPLASLGADTRAQLPPLKLSMHVYAAEPAQRFVILDGRRLGEGASAGAGIVLEEIRRDGLVLSVNGQRLLLARP